LYQLPSAGIRPRRRGGSGLERRTDGGLLPARTLPWITLAASSALIVALWLVGGILVGGAAWIPWFMLVIIPWRLAVLARRPDQQ
jgi:hypothetical protein